MCHQAVLPAPPRPAPLRNKATPPCHLSVPVGTESRARQQDASPCRIHPLCTHKPTAPNSSTFRATQTSLASQLPRQRGLSHCKLQGDGGASSPGGHPHGKQSASSVSTSCVDLQAQGAPLNVAPALPSYPANLFHEETLGSGLSRDIARHTTPKMRT